MTTLELIISENYPIAYHNETFSCLNIAQILSFVRFNFTELDLCQKSMLKFLF